jgi:hypothetical protein
MNLHRSCVVAAIVATIFVPGGTTVAAEGAPAAFEIPRLDGIAIDGDPSDWGERGLSVDALHWHSVRGSVADFDPHYRIGWNDTGLLVRAVVRDDALVSAPDPSGSLYGVLTADTLVVKASTGTDKPMVSQAVVCLGDAPDRGKVKIKTGLPGATAETSETLAQAAAKVTPDGYVYEVLLPWKAVEVAPTVGTELALQLLQCDDDPPGTSGQDTERAPTRWHASLTGAHPIRLSESSGPPVTVAVGPAAGWFAPPMVSITATAVHAGKPYSIRKGEKEIAKGVLELRDGRAVADSVLPRRRGKDVNKGLVVVVDGAPVGGVDALDAPERGENPSLLVRVASGAEPGRASIRTGLWLDDVPYPYPGASANITVRDAGERVVLMTKCMLDAEGTTVALPDGACTVHASVDSLEGWKCEGKEPCLITADLRKAAAEIADHGAAMSKDPKHGDYAGWLDYLATDIRQTLAAPATEATTRSVTLRAVELAGWMAKIGRDPRALAKISGSQEWAHLSKVDGTGQPFFIQIPEGYAPRKSYPLDVFLHGASGSHLNLGETEVPGIRLNVLARSSFGGYRGLAEVDVLEAIAYVRAHWNIDPDRIHLSGGSMGGGGTFTLGARHPDLFASARPFCGYGLQIPVGNLLHVPVCAVHSRDDWMVPIMQSRGATRALTELGGAAIQHETDGVGHNPGAWKEGSEFAHRWAAGHTRPREVRRVHYAATDELARKAYWAEVVEWGPESRPATIDARLDPDNTLYLSLDNVNIARFDIAAAPADAKTTLTVVVDRTVSASLASPLPHELLVSRAGGGWTVSPTALAPPAVRRHFPGGATAMFHGEPLLVVWGTRGGEEAVRRMREAAGSARKSTGPSWPKISPYRPPAFIFNDTRNTYYGQLPGKPDIEVTRTDMETHNLLLIGTAEQNSVVAKLADRLPVRAEGGRVTANDGVSWDFSGRSLGLLYHNPEAPARLIYWVASDAPAFYAPNAYLMERQGWGFASPDFLLTRVAPPGEVAARWFDSSWTWEPGYEASPHLSPESCSSTGAATMAAAALRRDTDADFAVLNWDPDTTAPMLAAGETRLADIVAPNYFEPLCVMDLTGKEILDAAVVFARAALDRSARVAKGDDADPAPQFLPQPESGMVRPERTYRVVLPAWSAWNYAITTRTNPSSFRLIPRTLRDALGRLPDPAH